MSEYSSDTGEEKNPDQGEGQESEGSEPESVTDELEDRDERAQEGA